MIRSFYKSGYDIERDRERLSSGRTLSLERGEVWKRVSKMIHNKRDLIHQHLEKGGDDAVRLFPLLSIAASADDQDTQAWAVAEVKARLPQILDLLETNPSSVREVVQYIPEFASYEQLERVRTYFLQRIEAGDFSCFVGLLMNPKNEKAKQFASVLCGNWFSSLGLLESSGPISLFRIWNWWLSTGTAQERFHWEGTQVVSIQKNLETMHALEKRLPGSVRRLHEEYGIRSFGRYPIDVLIRQLEEHDSGEQPYGIILFPRDDHNGAFYHNQEMVQPLLGELNGKYQLKVVECKDKLEMGRRLVYLHQRFGRASFALLGGHGEKDKIIFGDNRTRETTLHREDFEYSSVRGVKKFFVDHPTIILNSCSTGQEGGVGQELSTAFDAQVIAPNVQTAIKSISVSFDTTNRPVFQVQFGRYGVGTSYVAGVKAT